MTRRNWDSEPKKNETNSDYRVASKSPEFRRSGWAKSMTEQTQRDDLSHQQVLAAIWTDALGQMLLHDDRKEADNLCHPHGQSSFEMTSIR